MNIINAMSVDVEDYFHAASVAEVVPRSQWDLVAYRAEGNTRKLLRLFDEHGVRATFFILGWVARRSPMLVREIHAAGHEVACHGMTHEQIFAQSRETFTAETRDSKHLIEDIIGAPILGYRAASWSITKASLWALDIIHELGFAYDSSIFPVAHDRYGIPGAPRHPGFIKTPSGYQMLEFPPSTARLFGLTVPVAGGGYLRLLPMWLLRKGLRQINGQEHAPFMFYLHPWEVDPEQPRLPLRWSSRFRHYTNLAQTELRLSSILAEFPCGTAAGVLRSLELLPASARTGEIRGCENTAREVWVNSQ